MKMIFMTLGGSCAAAATAAVICSSSQDLLAKIQAWAQVRVCNSGGGGGGGGACITIFTR